jgi:hypothetical protein
VVFGWLWSEGVGPGRVRAWAVEKRGPEQEEGQSDGDGDGEEKAGPVVEGGILWVSSICIFRLLGIDDGLSIHSILIYKSLSKD